MTLGDLILKHYEPMRSWKPDVFAGWLAWSIHQGFVIRAVGDDDETVGVAVVRPVMKAEDGNDDYEFDPQGSGLFIDLLISLHPSAMAAIGFGVLKRFGMRKTVAWKRHPYNIIKTHSAARLRWHIFGKALAHGQGR